MDCWIDRPFVDNLISTWDCLQKTDSQILKLLRVVNGFPSISDQFVAHFQTILASFLNILSTSNLATIVASILTDFGPNMALQIRPFGTVSEQQASESKVPRIRVSYQGDFSLIFGRPFFNIDLWIDF